MAVKTSGRYHRPVKSKPLTGWYGVFLRYLPGWIMLAAVFAILLPNAGKVTLDAAGRALAELPRSISKIFAPQPVIAPLFTNEVEYWDDDIQRWATEHNLDPNLLATVMQIESCGHPTISSYAGAQGLFQVMPFHFSMGENQLDPDTNAFRGAKFLNYCVNYADGDVGLALACYNGGPSVVNKAYAIWPNETQRYYVWGMGIYADAANERSTSDTLNRWLKAGGSGLCQMAAKELGI